MRTLIDLVTPDEKFWIESHGARFLVRRLTLEGKQQIEDEVFEHGTTEDNLETAYLKDWMRLSVDKDFGTLKKANKAKEIGKRLAGLRRTRENKLHQLDEKVLDYVLLDWDETVGVGGVPVECTPERKQQLPQAIKMDILSKTQVRVNTRDDEKAEEAEEGN